MEENSIQILEGELFDDWRGRILSLNSFDFSPVERMYVIQNVDTHIIRGWHGHQRERKWFYCVKGEFTMAFVAVDDWDNPSKDLKPVIVKISSEKSQIIAVPQGYANCLRADVDDSVLVVFSDRRYPDCLDDSFRYEPNYWFDWSLV